MNLKLTPTTNTWIIKFKSRDVRLRLRMGIIYSNINIICIVHGINSFFILNSKINNLNALTSVSEVRKKERKNVAISCYKINKFVLRREKKLSQQKP